MKIYKHLIHRHVEFPVWGYWDKKREFIAFQPADERNSEHWNRLSIRRLFRPVFFGREKFNWSFPIIFISRKHSRNPMVVQWIGLYTSTAEGVGSIPGWGTKILCAVGSQKKRKHMSCQLCCFLLVDSSWESSNIWTSVLPMCLTRASGIQAKFTASKVRDPEQDWTDKQRNRKLHQHSAGRGSV